MVAWIQEFGVLIGKNKEYLTDLDSAIGDADHGINMDRGMRSVIEKIGESVGGDGEVATLLKTVAMTLISTVGGAAGPLYGTLFLAMAKATSGHEHVDQRDWAAALQAGVDAVKARGRAERGDKTMVDTLEPAVAALVGALNDGASSADAWRAAESAAEKGMAATVPLVAHRGRASYLGERSVGHQDPGATSAWLLIKAAAGAFGS